MNQWRSYAGSVGFNGVKWGLSGVQWGLSGVQWGLSEG